MKKLLLALLVGYVLLLHAARNWNEAWTGNIDASGLTILIGRVGQSCAWRPERPASNATAKSPPPAPENLFMHLPRARPISIRTAYKISCAAHTEPFAESCCIFQEIDYPLDPGQYGGPCFPSPACGGGA